MREWKECKLGELTSKIGSGSTPRGGSGVYKDSGIPFIRSQNILDLKFSEDGLVYIDEIQAKELSNVAVQKEDIFINITGDSVARVCKVPKEFIPARVNQHVAILRSDSKKLESDFLKYSLISMKEYLLSISEIGGTRRAITKGMLESLPILLPPLAEQKAIAGVLSALDDKIDLLHRQNKTLEAMAEALFRQWFVEPFDSAQGSGAEESWEEKTIGDVAIISAGGDKPELYSEIPTASCNIPIYSNGIEKEGLYGYTNVARIYEESITISARGTIGFINLRNSPYFPIVRLVSVIPNTNIISGKFLYLWAKTQFITGTGTTQQQLTVPDFSRTQMKVPSFELVSKFTDMVNPYFVKKNNNNFQIRSLEKLRDTLLPKLMSGEVRVEV